MHLQHMHMCSMYVQGGCASVCTHAGMYAPISSMCACMYCVGVQVIVEQVLCMPYAWDCGGQSMPLP